ncbi:MAG: cadherin domain-containing protein [Planctomycetota bacterium]
MIPFRRKKRLSALRSNVEVLEQRTVLTAPTFTSSPLADVPENQTTVTTVTATDADLDPLTFSIQGGADAALFSIDPVSGNLTFLAAPDYETPLDAGADNVYNVDIGVDDGNSGIVAQSMTITVTPLNDNNPVFTSPAAYNVNENTTAVGTVTTTDADLPAQVVTYSLTGGVDAALFAIDPSTGDLTFLAAPDFETPLDVGADNVYNVDVTADDGAGGTTIQSIAVTVVALNDNNPVFTSPAAYNVNENTTAVGTVTTTDADLPAQVVTYSLTGGVDAALFAIDPNTGDLTFIVAPDFETPLDVGADNVYNVDVTANDGAGGTTIQSIAVTVVALNDNNPVFTSPAAYNVDENTTAVGTVTATDADLPAQVLTYSLTGGVDAALFAIDPSTGDLTFLAAPDFETPLDAGADNVYNVDVTADDGAGGTTIQSIAITVVALNDNSPVFTSPAAYNVNENTTAVGTVTTTDADLPAQAITYSVTGGIDAPLFAIDPNTGDLTFLVAPDFETPLDDGADNVYNVDVTADDGAGGTTIQSIAITVVALNDNNPVFTSPAAYNVDENTTAVGTVTATDADLPAQVVTYSLTGGVDAALFAIDPNTGNLTFLAAPDFETPLDVGADNVYNVDVTADDGAGGTTIQSIAVTVVALNDNNPVFTSPAAYNVDENTTAVGTVTTTDADLPAQVVTYSLTGGVDAALFAIDPSTGDLTFIAAPDFETPLDVGADNVYNVDVTADDGAGGTTIQSIAITVVALNDNNPVFTSPAAYNVDENTTAVGTVTATDADLPAQVVTYSLTGGVDAALFAIDPNTGNLTFIAAPDFETPLDVGADNVYNVDVTADDGAGGTTIQSIAVTVVALNDNNPVFTSPAAYNVDENTTAVGTVTATDADLPAQVVTYSLTGGVDAALFAIDPSTGDLTFLAAPDFETPLDVGADNVYNIDVTADDGAGGTTIQSIAVTVVALNDNNPVFTSPAAYNVDENTTAVGTVTTTDADLPAQVVTYSLTGGVDAALFAIDPNTGNLTFIVAPDFETPLDVGADNVYNVDVTANDGAGGTTIQSIAVTVVALNDNNPVFTSPAAYNVDENTTAVGTVTATDADLPAQVLTYSLTGGVDAALFAIDPSTGDLTFLAAPDFETPLDAGADNVYNVDVTADDGAGGTTIQSIAITVVALNDNSPVFTSPAAYNVNENTTAVGTVTTTDADLPAQAITYSVTGGIDAPLFAIDPNTGDLTFLVAPDFETPLDDGADNVYNVDVTADDGAGGTTIQSIAITVVALNDNNPVFTSPAAYNVDENTTAVGTVTATDADLPAQVVTYSLTGGVDAALFAIDPNTGNLTFLAAPDFETPLDVGADNVYNVDVTADDGAGGTTIQSIAVTVVALNDNNPVFTSPAAYNVDENTTAVGTVTTTDADLPAQVVTYSLTGGVDAALFAIDPSTGDLTFIAAPDFETPLDVGADNVYNVDVTADDGAGGTTIQSIAITVVALNDNNPVFTSPAAYNVDENTTAVGTVTATDADLPAQVVTYSLTGGVDAALFAIDPNTGNLTFIAAPDFETPLDVGADNVYNVDVTADDGAGGTTIQSIAVTVVALNDNNPVFTSPAAYNVDENTTAVGTVTATDADLPAQVVTYSLTGGVDAALFAIDPSTGDLTFIAAPDFETPLDVGADNVYNVDVTADDGAGGTTIQSIAITVVALNDNNPVFTSPTTYDVAENTTAVGTATATDADLPAQVVTYSLTGGVDAALFAIDPNTGDLTFIAAPDFETPLDVGADNVYNVDITADDGNGGTTIQSVAITVTAVNDNSPIFTSPAAYNVDENTTAVGTVTATDADLPAETVTYSLTGGVDAALFAIDPSTGDLTFIAAPDFENPLDVGADNVYNVDITADDGNGGTTIQSVAITVVGVNESPVITSPAAYNVPENTTAVGTVTSTDPDLPAQVVTYSVTGGVDAALFAIDPNTGELTFIAAPDFETPLDVGADNVYNVDITADDGNGGTVIQSIAVTVTAANDNAPVFTSPAAYNVAENTTAVGTVTATDADLPAQTVTYSITGGVDAALFAIDPSTGALTFIAAPDFENPTDVGANNVYDVQVSADDGNGSITAQDIAVTVTDAVEGSLITLNPDTGTYHLKKDRAFVDPTATFVSGDPDVDYTDAKLTVSIVANANRKDVLSVFPKGNGADQINVKGKKILYEGVVIGTFKGGRRGQDLVITFNGAATEAAVNQLVKRVNFNAKDRKLPQATRTLQMQVTNLGGQDSNQATRQIDVVAAVD